jgi:hypothetical protein
MCSETSQERGGLPNRTQTSERKRFFSGKCRPTGTITRLAAAPLKGVHKGVGVVGNQENHLPARQDQYWIPLNNTSGHGNKSALTPVWNRISNPVVPGSRSQIYAALVRTLYRSISNVLLNPC